MRLLTLLSVLVLVSACGGGGDAPDRYNLLHRTAPAALELGDKMQTEGLFAGVVVASDVRVAREELTTCVTIREASGAIAPLVCSPGGREGVRARLVSGFPSLVLGDRVHLRAHRVAGAWHVVQHSVRREHDSVRDGADAHLGTTR